MIRFELHRHVDISGVSGTGVVAEGVIFTDNTVAMRWLGATPSTVHHDGGIAAVEHIHSHGGLTHVEYLDYEHDLSAPVTARSRR